MDAVEPPRKRRRPALACFECRRKKIKCDRNNPCRQCTQNKSAKCVYGPDASYSNKQPVGHLPSPVESGRRTPDAAAHQLVHSARNAVPRSSDHAAASTSSQKAAPLVEAPIWWDVDTGLSVNGGANESVRNRTQRRDESPSRTHGASREASTPERTRVNFSKTRVFGRSHWMSYFNSVRPSNVPCYSGRLC
jgi:Fungal Zn(2)-Cys(6) binuclear cluster domain